MVQLEPFRAVTYDAAHVGDLAAVTAPPYDAIDAERAAALRQRSPYNVVHLELSQPEVPAAEGAVYVDAAATYQRWLAEGVLVPEPTARLYAYVQTYVSGGVEREQRGLVGALTLEPWSTGVVMPHERVWRAAVEDRLRLLRALPVNTSPIYLLTDGPVLGAADLLDAATADAPVLDLLDPDDGVRHRLWPLDDRTDVSELASARCLLADGHHRYTTALEYRASSGVNEPGAAALLAYIVVDPQGTEVRAMHRTVRELPVDVVERLHSVGLRSAQRASDDAVAAVGDGQSDLALVTSDGSWSFHIDHAYPMPSDVHPLVWASGAGRLEAAGLTVDAAAGVVATPDLDAALAAVGAASAAAVVLPPLALGTVVQVARDGALMPAKSTSFFPKPRTGLVLRPLRG